MRFSIVIPSCDRPQRLRQCLDAISRLDYAASQVEVIVVDDGSEPPLQEAIAAGGFSTLQLRILRQPNAGPAAARNRGAAHAAGEWIAFLDDDCMPRREWLKELDSAARRHPRALLGGSTRNGCPDNLFAEINQHLVDFVVSWFERSGSHLRFFPSNNFAVETSAFRASGGFDSAFPVAGGEDREFCARWLDSGGEMVRVPHAWIDHFHPQTLGRFLKMHYRYGRGAALLHRLRRTSPEAFRPGSFLRDLLREFAVNPRTGRSSASGLALVALTQSAAACGFLRERLNPSRQRPSSLPRTRPAGTPGRPG